MRKPGIHAFGAIAAAGTAALLLLLAHAGSGPALAQGSPELTVSPASGPCDGAVEVMGTGFPPDLIQPIHIADPRGGQIAPLTEVLADSVGSFTAEVTLGEIGCVVARADALNDAPGEPREVFIWAGYALRAGGARPLAETAYEYTSTLVGGGEIYIGPPFPDLSISPESGPCDATVELTGTGFEPRSVTPIEIARPHSEGAFGLLVNAEADSAGDFVLSVSLGELGCTVAAIDDEVDDPGEPKTVFLYAGYEEARRGPLAAAAYTYTTTSVVGASPPPVPDLKITPSSGPCDATVELKGTGFPPRSGTRIEIARPHAEGAFGLLSLAEVDDAGGFVLQVNLGALGCPAALRDDRLDAPGEPKTILIMAGASGRQPPATAEYTYTTTMRGAGAALSALPSAGSGGKLPGHGAGGAGGDRTAAYALGSAGIALVIGAAVRAIHKRRQPETRASRR